MNKENTDTADETFAQLFNEFIYDGLDEDFKDEDCFNAFSELAQLHSVHFDNEKFSDLVLNVNDTLQFRVHKIILAMSSEVFATMLFDPNWTRSRTCVSLFESPSSLKIFNK